MSAITMRQLIETIRDDADPRWPIDAVYCFSGVLRSFMQREVSTIDGDLQTASSWVEMNGAPTAESVENFINNYPGIMAIEVPMSVVKEWLESED